MTLNKSDRILVTGAAGLMGSALVEHLHGQGYANVIALTRADCDLLDTAATFAAFERLKPDHVFHSAARVYGILGSLKNQGPLFYDNVMMNTNVVEAVAPRRRAQDHGDGHRRRLSVSFARPAA